MQTYNLYNNTIFLNFDPQKHHYTVGNETIDGVTSILSVINKPALVFWSANKAAEYVDLNLPVGRIIDEMEKKKLVEGAKKAHRTFLKDAADLGTLLHELVEKYIKKESYQEPTNEILLKSFDRFRGWVTENNVSFLESEKKIYSKKYNYCGTIDFIATVNGKLVLADLKTSSGVYEEMFLQTAAYKAAYMEEFPEQKIETTMIVRCGKDGALEIREMNDFDANFNAFLGALTLYRRLKEMKFDAMLGKQIA